MAQVSAGLLMCRHLHGVLEFFLVHPGGPFYKNKHEGVWSIPKGLVLSGEGLLESARREFQEETGLIPTPPFHSLEATRLKSGKIIHAWAFTGSWDELHGITSNTFPLEWPPRSGKFLDIPEADRATWATFEKASKLIHPAQMIFLQRAVEVLKGL